MNLIIRHATAADAPAIARFNVALARESESLALSRRIVGAGVKSLLENPAHGFYIVADTGKKIIGMTMITYEWSDWRNKVIWWLQSVYVDPAFRRQGIFSKLYLYIKDLAALDGNVASLRLYAEKDNRAAHRTYRALGMEQSPYRTFEAPLEKRK